MRISGDWMVADTTSHVLAAIGAETDPVYFVGGCVRNAVLGQRVADIDLATPLVPEEVMRRARAAGLSAIPTGLSHGTVTVVADHARFEVTTFRKDIETDGRRAVVAFSTDIRDDAMRRDFTMNALYAEPDGTLIDPLDGRFDLFSRTVRFVGDPHDRIAEDYLRILRFFRIIAWYADPARGIDPAGLAACGALREGLGDIARERIGAEMRKLLAAPDPTAALTAMSEAGVLAQVLAAADAEAAISVIALEKRLRIAPSWLRRLTALGGQRPADAFKLPRAQAEALRAGRRALSHYEAPAARAFRHGAEAARTAILIEATRGMPLPDRWQDDVFRGAAATFPITGRDLTDKVAPGPALGARLEAMRNDWIASDFKLTRDALLSGL
ncbi:MAG: CCA tRNA nucleotidyltransferase [Pseudomonadota bacterium]